MDWSSREYTKFESQRTRPAVDLLARVKTDGVTCAVDLGCGPGNSTALLVDRFPQAQVLGFDTSADMLAAARARLPGCVFREGDIATWTPDVPPDVIFANASLQWVPDHETRFPSLLRALSRGGTLAVQMPDNLDEPTHRLMREIAADGPWAGRLADADADRAPRHPAGWYYALLAGSGAHDIDIWRTTYLHPLAGAGAIVEWLKGTGLRPYLARLAPEETDAFLGKYHDAVAAAYPAIGGGTVLLPFPRLFVVATRG